jgi:hypothetical protein
MLLAALAPASPAKEPQKAAEAATDYVRFSEDENGARLETTIVTLKNKIGVRVALIGAVHVGDKAYYEKLNEVFTHYEAVLYELVGGGYSERKQRKTSDTDTRLHAIGSLQKMMKDALALESQLEHVDYTAKNFVHADMGTRQFFDTQKEKGETFLGLWWKAVKAQMDVAESGDAPEQPGLVKLLEILCKKDSATELKRLVGREFDEIEAIIAGVESDGGTVILGERNRIALEKLDREIAGGKKNLAIFYGAAHLQDMETRLKKKGFEIEKTEWLTAWDLPPEPKVEAATPR